MRNTQHKRNKENATRRELLRDDQRQSISATASMPTAINAKRWRTSRTASPDTRQTVAEHSSTLHSTYFPQNWGKYRGPAGRRMQKHRLAPNASERSRVYGTKSMRLGQASSTREDPEHDYEDDQRNQRERHRGASPHRSDPRPSSVNAKSSKRSRVHASPKPMGMTTASISTNCGTNGSPTTQSSMASNQLATRSTAPA